MGFDTPMTEDETAMERVDRAIALYNGQRAQVAKRMLFRLMFVVVPVIVIAATGVFIVVTHGPDPIVFGALLFCFGLFWWGGTVAVSPSRKFQRELRAELLPAVFDFVDDCTYRLRRDPGFTKRFPIDAHVQYVDSRHFYMVGGSYQGMQFTLTGTQFSESGDGGSDILFDGIVLQFALARPFPGTLLAVPQAFSANRKVHNFFQRRSFRVVRSGDRKVDHFHEFLVDSSSAETMLIEGELKGILYLVGRTWPADLVHLVLCRETGFLLITTEKNRFELPGLDQSINYDRHLLPMAGELLSLLIAAHSIRGSTAVGEETLS